MGRRVRFAEIRHPGMLLAFGLGSGLAPKAPGTFGTVLGLTLYLPFYWLAWPWALALVVAGAILGVWLCQFASDRLGEHDHSGIVWDEFVGIWLTLLLLPATLSGLILGFLLFRFFDVLKPWPIGWLDRRVHGGLGVMLDDLVAALMAGASGWVLMIGWWQLLAAFGS